MAYLIKNISTNRPIVCTLPDGETFRLNVGEQKTVKDSQFNDYLKGLSDKHLILVRKVEQKKTTKKKEE